MLTLRANNSFTFVDVDTKTKEEYRFVYSTLRDILSYTVPNAEWSDKYKTGVWDGKLSLYNGTQKKFPAGLTDLVINELTTRGVKFSWVDERELPTINAKYTADYGTRVLRDYQLEAPVLAKKHSRGIIAMGTGSGKTLVLCQMMVEIQCNPVCVIVPSISLLRQTADEIEATLKNKGKPVKVGRVGGGFWEINFDGINVCTYQSALSAFNTKWLESKNQLVYDEFAGEKVKKSIFQLEKELKQAQKTSSPKEIKKLTANLEEKKKALANKKDAQELLKTCQVFVVDECHLAAEIIEFLSGHAETAYYKIGLSATPWRTDNQEIRIEGALGGILIDVTSSDLIKRGFLCKPTIMMFKIHSKNQCRGYQECYTKNIVFNDEKNTLIKQFAEECFQNQIPTVILVERLEHGKILEELIDNSLFVPGKEEKGDDAADDKELDYRRRQLEKLGRNEIILIATQWIYTGVDCPPMQCLILAGSCSSSVTTYQQIGRVLRLSPQTNKHYSLVIDFYDQNRYFKGHGAARKATYMREPEYELKIISN